MPTITIPRADLTGEEVTRALRAEVTLTRPSGQTVIRIRPGGTSSEFPVNALGIARKIRQVLATAFGIRQRA